MLYKPSIIYNLKGIKNLPTASVKMLIDFEPKRLASLLNISSKKLSFSSSVPNNLFKGL